MTKPLKVAIIGTADCSRGKAPYDNESWEIWSLGANAKDIPRFDRWFELHTERVLKNARSWENIFPFFGQCGDKLYLGHPCSDLPFAKPFPIEKIKEKFGTYFTSTIAYLIAFAILEGATEIGLWGISMLADEEYSRQRPCVEYYLGMARGLGINVVIAEESPVLRAERMYAFEYCELSAEIAQMTREVDAAVEKANSAKFEANCEAAYRKGMRDMLLSIHRRFG